MVSALPPRRSPTATSSRGTSLCVTRWSTRPQPRRRRGLGRALQAVQDLSEDPDAALQLGKATTIDEIAELAKIVLSSTRELGESYFASKEARALIATWGLHLDFGPDVSAGGMFPFLEAFTDMEEGMSVVEGGASNLVDALAAIIREHGGDVRTGDAVARILTDGGRATDVETEGGERFYAEKAIVANLTPTLLFNRLLPDADLPQDFRDSVARFTYGPATMMMHLALDGPAPWKAGQDVHEYAYVHIAPYVEDLARTYTEAQNGLLPTSPLLIVGQTTAVDPSRTPGDEQLLWIQVRTLPALIRGDAKGEIEATHWDEAKAPFAERVLAKLEDYAPGIREKIIGQYVMSPQDLERGNPNLVGGDSIGGSHHLHQNFLWRPFFGWSRYKMPLEGLYMVGAGTWPGGGNNATSGYLAAQEVLKADGLSVGQKIAAGAAGAVAAGAMAAALKKLIGEKGQTRPSGV